MRKIFGELFSWPRKKEDKMDRNTFRRAIKSKVRLNEYAHHLIFCCLLSFFGFLLLISLVFQCSTFWFHMEWRLLLNLCNDAFGFAWDLFFRWCNLISRSFTLDSGNSNPNSGIWNSIFDCVRRPLACFQQISTKNRRTFKTPSILHLIKYAWHSIGH